MKGKELAGHVDTSGNIQLLKDHLEGTGDLAEQFADKFGYGPWGRGAGKIHDIGKSSDAFQKRLLDQGPRVDHSTAGALEVVRLFPGTLYSDILSKIVAGHHSGLLDEGTAASPSHSATMSGRLKKKVEDYSRYRELGVIPAPTPPNKEHQKILQELGRKYRNKDEVVRYKSFLTRMLFSCLVDADYLDTEKNMQGRMVKRGSVDSMQTLLRRLQCFIDRSGYTSCKDLESLAGHRAKILQACISAGKTVEKGCYKLSAPTGSGKTISSLAFALEHAVNRGLDRVIFVIPYTSIIEQTAAEYKKILGDNAVLEHHSNFDFSVGEEGTRLDLAAENWDYPIVITTNVQFFESFYHNRSSRCRKLHNVANSLVVFDEVQMLPQMYLKPCTEVMTQLVSYYGASILMCSATQPTIEVFLRLSQPVREICPNPEEEYEFFQRISYENDGLINLRHLAEKIGKEKQALCIVNTRRSAQDLYFMLKNENVFHLSTLMYPVHRKRTIEKIRSLLKEQKPVTVISTSLVECGVDFDFRTIYRELTGLDSIIQAAGRCNREGKRTRADSIVHIFELTAGDTKAGVTRTLMTDMAKLDAPANVENYFSQMFYLVGGKTLDAKDILANPFDFATVAEKFKMIEDASIHIYVPLEAEASDLYDELLDTGPTKPLLRKMQLYMVEVPKGQKDLLLETGAIAPIPGIEDTYVLIEGNQYKEETGLRLAMSQS